MTSSGISTLEQVAPASADSTRPWNAALDAPSTGVPGADDRDALDVAARWDGLLRHVAVRLAGELGAEVTVVTAQDGRCDSSQRATADYERLVAIGALRGTIRVPDAASPVELIADVQTGWITTSIDASAPDHVRPATRVSWLVDRALEPPSAGRMDARVTPIRDLPAAPSSRVVEGSTSPAPDPGRELLPSGFSPRSSGLMRDAAPGTCAASLRSAVDAFYRDVADQLRAMTPVATALEDGAELAVLDAA